MNWTSWLPRKKERRFQHPREENNGENSILIAAPGPELLSFVKSTGEEALRRAGSEWSSSDIRVQAHAERPLSITLIGFRRILVSINPQHLVAQARLVYRSAGAPNPISAIEDAVFSYVRLFAGHFTHCPYDLARHRNLVRATRRGAYGDGWVSEREEEIAERITAFFEQNVVSYRIAREEGEPFVVGLLAEREINRQPQDLLRTLFQQAQALILPDLWKNRLPMNVLDSDLLAAALLPDAVRIIFGTSLVLRDNRLSLTGTARPPRSWDWRDCAEDLGELLGPYVEDESGQDDVPSPFGSQRGAGPDQEPGGGGNDPSLPNPFLGQGPGDSGGEDQDGAENGFAPGGNLPGPPSRHSRSGFTFEALDTLYSKRASDLVVKDGREEGPEMEPDQLEIGFISSEPADLREALFGEIDWVRTRFGEPTPLNPLGINFYRRCDPLLIPASQDEQAGVAVPSLQIAVDSSGSMTFSPFADDPEQRGRFDTVLCACYGVFRFLERIGPSDGVQINAINFSDVTESGGWRPVTELEPAKRTLTHYQGGGTRLDARVLTQAYRSRPGPILSIFITDGMIGNANEVLAIVQRMINEGNAVVLLHVGAGNEFTVGVEKAGGTVHVIADARELVGLCLDVAQDRFRGAIA